MTRRSVALLVTSAWIALAAGVPRAAGPQRESSPAAAAASSSRAVLDTYCVTCHNDRLKTAGLALDRADVAHVANDREVWEKVVKRLQIGSMPPQPMKRPDEATRDRLVAWLETELDRAAAAAPNPGRPLLHRLNRAEYTNAIRDLLALDVNAASLLPPDDAAFGFDNVSDVLGVSPLLLERYLSAAGKISALAIGDPEIQPGAESYRCGGPVAEISARGVPLGTVGGLWFVMCSRSTAIPRYLFKNNVMAIRGRSRQVEISVDGERIL